MFFPKKYFFKSFISVSSLLVTGFSLIACEGAREVIGAANQPPDEFAVVTRAPLNMPPDYGLRPPRPGAKRPQEKIVIEIAKESLLRSVAPKIVFQDGEGKATAEAVLLRKAGATTPDPNIRVIISREASILASKDDSFTEKLIFWQSRPKYGTIVDAKAEQRRLRDNAALGEAPTKGRSPQITRESKGLLEGVFN